MKSFNVLILFMFVTFNQAAWGRDFGMGIERPIDRDPTMESSNHLHTDGEYKQKSNWYLIPGVYRGISTNGDSTSGVEVTLMYKGIGLVYGHERRTNYVEAEVYLLFLSVGAGGRLDQDGRAPQYTFALPFFFVFPYYRLVDVATTRQEGGVMLKVPFGLD